MTNTFNIDRFTYIKEIRQFVVEASDLAHRSGEKIPATIVIHNPDTGNNAYFCFENISWTDDNDVLGWNFSCSEFNCVLFIFND